MSKQKRVAIYARVSTASQNTDNQLNELRAVAENRGWLVVGEYVDEAISGSKGRDQRPAFDRLQKAAIRGEFDSVAAWSVDRLGRSLRDLLDFLGEIQASEVDLYLHQQGVDTSTPAGKALFQMLGVFAEFEKSMIKERVRSGLATAKAKGRVGGRPKVSPEIEEAIRSIRTNDPTKGMIKIAKEVGVGVGTVQRVLASA